MTGDRFTVAGRIEQALASHDPEASAAKVREQLAARREYVEETARGGFPVYEVPPFVADRFPGFDPADPSTWPEPGKCTEGRPWGIDAYGSVWGSHEDRWRNYLTGPRPRACRNRWRDPVTHLCGTHLNAYRARLDDARKRAARYARTEDHADLARQLAAYAIEADSSSAGVILPAESCRALLRILAEADTVAPL